MVWLMSVCLQNQNHHYRVMIFVMKITCNLWIFSRNRPNWFWNVGSYFCEEQRDHFNHVTISAVIVSWLWVSFPFAQDVIDSETSHNCRSRHSHRHTQKEKHKQPPCYFNWTTSVRNVVLRVAEWAVIISGLFFCALTTSSAINRIGCTKRLIPERRRSTSRSSWCGALVSFFPGWKGLKARRDKPPFRGFIGICKKNGN